jgi:hypothetical protein
MRKPAKPLDDREMPPSVFRMASIADPLAE